MPLINMADFNRDGMWDLSFITQTGSLTILYNQYPAQGPKSEELCNAVGNTSQLALDPIFAKYPFKSG